MYCFQWGYCQCASYRPGDPACSDATVQDMEGSGGEVQEVVQETEETEETAQEVVQEVVQETEEPEESAQEAEGVCGEGPGSCCHGAPATTCPAHAPVCSEWGYCQCAEYVVGGPPCLY